MSVVCKIQILRQKPHIHNQSGDASIALGVPLCVPRSGSRSLFTPHSIFIAFVCICTSICICTTICICSCICIYVFVGCAKVREAFLVLLLTLYSYNPRLLLLFPASLLYEDAKSDITRCRHEVCQIC